jgi:ABC-type amino acid transport substrate-binding protein
MCLDSNSVVARHALRFGIVAAIAVVIFWFFPPPFGYWIPLTVTVVLKPYAGATLARTVQRVIGTSGGILVGSALMPFLAGPQAELAAVGILFFWMMVVLPFNYSLAIFFLSAGLIPFEHFLMPGLEKDVALLRLAGTGIGAILAIVGGHLLWPSFERKTLPVLLRASITSMALYVDRVLSKADAASFEAAHRQAGLDTTNLQAAIQRSATEIGGDAEMMAAFILAAASLQRLFITLNAVANVLPAAAGPTMEGFRDRLVSSLRNLAAGGNSAADLGAGTAFSGFLGYELGRMASEVALLRIALARLADRTEKGKTGMRGRRTVIATGLALLAAPAARAAAPPPTLSPGVLRIGTYFVNPPFEFIENGKKVGYEVGLMGDIARRIGLAPHYVNTRWETILREMQEGRYDCIVGGITITPARERILAWSVPYMTTTLSLIVNSVKTPDITGLAQMKTATVGVQAATTDQDVAIVMQKKGEIGSVKIYRFDRIADAMTDLEAGRITAVMKVAPVASYLARRMPGLRVVAQVPDDPQPLGIGFTKNAQALEAAVNAALGTMRRDGTLAQLASRWGVPA